MRPLYRSLAERSLARDPTGHAGLWYDKLCDRWDDRRWTLASEDKSSPKHAWIATVADGHAIGEARLVDEAAKRVARVATAHRGQFCVLITESRFVTGLGRSHPIENGFAWHPSLGVPYLPGSSVKGLVRAWAESLDDAVPAELAALFGPAPDADLPRATGDLIFLDAVPTAPVALEIDVMTPHHANWTLSDPPADWRSPVPVPFLVVAARTRFVFAVLSRRRDPDAAARAVRWLCDAARDVGAGAKTAIGYGRFSVDASETDRRHRAIAGEHTARLEQHRRADLTTTPEGRWRLALEARPEADVLEQVRKRFDPVAVTDPDDHRAFARAVTTLPYFADWLVGKPRDTTLRIGRDKLKARARLVREAAQRDSEKIV